MRYNVGILATHPIQYYVPWYRALSKHPNLKVKVFYAHRQTPYDEARLEFGVPFKWDIPLLEGYDYHFLNNKSSSPNVVTFFGCNTPEIIKLIEKYFFDAFIVHGWYNLSYLQAIVSCWKLGIPVIVRGDSQLLRRSKLIAYLKFPIYRIFLSRFSSYLSVGQRAEEYYRFYGADGNRIFHAPHSVDNDFFSKGAEVFMAQSDSLRLNFGIPKEAVLFLFVGKLVSRKRPDVFIKAIKLSYIKKNRTKRLFGLIVGEGALREKLEMFVIREKLPVVFLGFLNQTQMPKVYAMADILVLPSKETWGLVVNEAMASGLPAIVSDRVGCAPDLIIPGRTGYTFRYGDSKQLAELMSSLAEYPERLKKMGEEAKIHISRYSINEVVKATIDAVDFVVTQKQKIGFVNGKK